MARLAAASVALVLACSLSLPVCFASGKKGIAISHKHDPDGSKLRTLNVRWYYNWTLAPNSIDTADCFVPMFWGKRGQLASVELPDRVPLLLTFNEPDFPNQANRSVEEVLEEWPRLAPFAEHLSAPTAGRPFDSWMRSFMAKAHDRGLRPAVLPVHWYGAPDAKRFLGFIDRLHQQYGLPLWITEFAVADWHATKYGTPNRFTDSDVAAFLNAVLPELERRTFVQRYAWLGAETDKASLQPSRLFNAQGRLTVVGEAYAKFDPASENCAPPQRREAQ